MPGDTEYTVQETVPEGYIASKDTNYKFDINSPYEEIKPCNWLQRELGANGVVAIKKGNQYFVWTTVELNNDEKSQLLSEIRTITNGFGDSNTTFGFGTGNFNVLDGTFEFNYSNGVLEMSINASNAWSWLLLGTYTKSVSTTITNSVDTDKTINIPVEKIWQCDSKEYSYDYVTVQLYQNGDEYREPLTITADKGWKNIFSNLPYYSTSGERYTYTIREISFGYENGTPIFVEDAEGWLFVNIDGNADDGFKITNAIPQEWHIRKVSTTDNDISLGGAKFTLTKEREPNVRYYGATFDENNLPIDDSEGYQWFVGYVYWWDKEEDVGYIARARRYIPAGTDILRETVAPDGYMVSGTTWTIEISEDLQTIEIKDNNDNIVTEYNPDVVTYAAVINTEYLFTNTPLYDLPSAGGPGIYWYTIGGMLLMIAGTLILYKNKRREVLKR